MSKDKPPPSVPRAIPPRPGVAPPAGSTMPKSGKMPPPVPTHVRSAKADAPKLPAPPPPEAEAPPRAALQSELTAIEETPALEAVAAEAPLPGSRDTASNRRVSPRLPAEIEVGVTTEHNFFTGFSLDISEGGIFVATHVDHPVGTRLEIRVAFPDGAEPMVLIAEVRWKRELRDTSDASPGLGLRFVEPTPGQRAKIHAFIKHVRDPLFHDEDL